MTTYKVIKPKIEARTRPNGSVSGKFYYAGNTFDNAPVESDWLKVAEKQYLPPGSFVKITTSPPADPPPVIDPELPLPSGDGKIYQILELVDGTWKHRCYIQEVSLP